MSAVMTIVGRLTDDPRIRFTQNGDTVVSFSVAHTDRKYDKASNQWVDAGETLFMNVVAFKQLADGAGDALSRGKMVIVTGRVRQKSYDAKDGTRKSGFELMADEIGVSVRAFKSVQQQPVQEPAW